MHIMSPSHFSARMDLANLDRLKERALDAIAKVY
jgi:hypothetical protein